MRGTFKLGLFFLLFLPLVWIFTSIARIYADYGKVKVKMTETEVVSILGEVSSRNRIMPFCESGQVWTGACPENDKTQEFIVFEKGFNTWVVVGFDDEGKLSFKTVGDR